MSLYHALLRLAIICLLVCAGLFALFLPGWAQATGSVASSCQVFGTITGDITWTPADCDPYVVTGNMKIATGATLTLEPGTTVAFTEATLLEVDGALVARGEAAQPITFTAAGSSPTGGHWARIQFNDSSTDATYDGSGNYSGGSVIQHAIVEYAGGSDISNNAALRLVSASPLIDHVIIRNNDGWAISGGGDNLHITNSAVMDNEKGLYLSSDDIVVSGNTVNDNQFHGIWLTNTGGVISNNTVSRNVGVGINLSTSWSGKPVVSDNLIVHNQEGGVVLRHGNPIFRSNTIMHNTSRSSGAGIYVASGGPVIEHTTVMSNTSEWNGGGVSVFISARVDIHHSSITHNSALRGGGIYLSRSTSATVSNSNIYGNSAPEGSAIYNESSRDIDAANNYWQTTDDQAIEARIWHFVDDAAMGSVTYTPYSTSDLDILPAANLCYLPLVQR